MTGVAAQMCADPPADILEQFPELKTRVGLRARILNDLSPAACHIAYNYNTPVDVDVINREFERIKAAVKNEFDWLYGTEHYEPALGPYDPASAEVASRLKNQPTSGATQTLLGGSEHRDWELISRAEVESRLGYSVAELPRDEKWGDLDVAEVEQWLCIPATIQYTIWSDVYRCEGFVTIEEPTGKISTRGKNAGKPIMSRKKVGRGCGHHIVLWSSALLRDTGEVLETFNCPRCGQAWKKIQLTRVRETPVETFYAFRPIGNGSKTPRLMQFQRKLTKGERGLIDEIEERGVPYWYPNDRIDMGREMLLSWAPEARRHDHRRLLFQASALGTWAALEGILFGGAERRECIEVSFYLATQSLFQENQMAYQSIRPRRHAQQPLYPVLDG